MTSENIHMFTNLAVCIIQAAFHFGFPYCTHLQKEADCSPLPHAFQEILFRLLHEFP